MSLSSISFRINCVTYNFFIYFLSAEVPDELRKEKIKEILSALEHRPIKSLFLIFLG
jgi:hypothetical protein